MDTMEKLAEGSCPLVPTDVYTAAEVTSVVAIDVSNPTLVLQPLVVALAGVTMIEVDIPARGHMSWHGPQVLEIGQVINISAGDVTCTYHISGVTIV